MKTKGLVNLYVVRKGDTVESITSKFNISEKVFYQYNRIKKYVQLIPGEPVYIISIGIEEIIDMKIENDETALYLNEMAYLIKEGYASQIFYEDNFVIVQENIEEKINNLTMLIEKLSSEEKSILANSLNIMVNKTFEFIPILKQKNNDALNKYQSDLKDTYDKFEKTLETLNTNLNKELLKSTLKDINKTIQMLAIKMLVGEFKEADTAFKELQGQFLLVNKIFILQ